MAFIGKQACIQQSYPEAKFHGICGRIAEIREQEVLLTFDRGLFNIPTLDKLWVNQRYLLLLESEMEL